MKKVVLTLFTLATLAACSSTEIIHNGSSYNNAIAFGNVCTRAGLSDLQNDGFGVWAVYVNEAQPAGYWLLDNETVYLKDGDWTYDNTQRWLSNSIFHFFAAYPYNVGFQELRQELNGTYYTGYRLEVTADGSADTEDILVATNVTNTNVEGYNTTVPLTFGHLLTKINLTVSQNTDIDSEFEYYVTKITYYRSK